MPAVTATADLALKHPVIFRHKHGKCNQFISLTADHRLDIITVKADDKRGKALIAAIGLVDLFGITSRISVGTARRLAKLLNSDSLSVGISHIGGSVGCSLPG